MDIKARHLVTSADEQTWKFDRPTLFLREIDMRYQRRHIWKTMDYKLVQDLFPNQKEVDFEYEQAKNFEEKLFPVLCKMLNSHHRTNYSERFWKILIGHWFCYFVDLVYSKVRVIEKCLDENYISGITLYDNVDLPLAAMDFASFVSKSRSAHWQKTLETKIFSVIDFEKLDFDFVNSLNLGTIDDIKPNSLDNPHALRGRLQKRYWQYSRKFVRDRDALIINSYLPPKEELKLNILMWQLPQRWSERTLKLHGEQNPIKRCELSAELDVQPKSNAELAITSLLFDAIPSCYLEEFTLLQASMNALTWPKCPKFIFTSNSFSTDEVFKLWAALKTESGTPYFIGQHGNDYGTSRYFNRTVEEVTPDKFLTWGWTDNLTQHTAGFNLKTVSKKRKTSEVGGLLLVESSYLGDQEIWNRTLDFNSYFAEQQKFVDLLPNELRNETTIRLYYPSVYKTGDELFRWRDFDPSIKLDYSSSYEDLAAKSRIIVFSYDSTGMLEALTLDIPFIAFWSNGLDHLRESAVPLYQSLVDVGIIHFTPESASDKVKEVWSDIPEWWNQESVQLARKEFCRNYARKSKKPLRELKKLMKT